MASSSAQTDAQSVVLGGGTFGCVVNQACVWSSQHPAPAEYKERDQVVKYYKNAKATEAGRIVNMARELFAGDRLDFLGEGADAARGMPAGLKKTVLSLRHLWNIVKPWKAHNFDKPIDHYILNEFIRPAVAEDQVYLVQLFCRFRFFREWTIDRLEIPGLTETKLLAFQGRQAM